MLRESSNPGCRGQPSAYGSAEVAIAQANLRTLFMPTWSATPASTAISTQPRHGNLAPSRRRLRNAEGDEVPRLHVGNAWRRQLLDRDGFDTPVTFRTEDNDVTRWLTTALNEYHSLRAESLQAMQAQQSILQFGVTGVAVLTGLGLQNNDKLLAILVLLVFVPLLSIFITSVWFVEIFRSIRAGMYIACLEKKINAVIGGSIRALEWESWLQDHPEARMFTRDRMSFGIIYIFNVGGIILAAHLAKSAKFRLTHPLPVIVGFGLVSGFLLIAGVLLYRRYERKVHSRIVDLNANLEPL